MNKNLRVSIALLIIASFLSIRYVADLSYLNGYFDFITVLLALVVMPRPKFALWPRKN
ncbi:hypothetical protein [Liquorilactobacillus satsumensis]|uniref:hypothetical protein n=1 Tax=Liquorilactobacillus satsumensis TaxID=259059 RepID=UPI000AD2B25F|nr:hypothetical protein [Liquorilactobacillus satsumensis]MCP9312829.1 hypothetical protein [Liquorilactobacillus satsumensis]MCP9329238.1 hypothetical protein [Liquorilactobacillus satsumensis]MCP9357799.1 hypothetical protein [Liquorilactobacillus satsumensis]MCP9359925.1 hypothetical protein [Liquorilactobacillus satsumensis]MCP9371539.1 hypothetical protein [Liquorilactobacillus satsumensis]